MNYFGITLPDAQKFFIIFVRLATILVIIPFYGERNVPMQLKLGLAFVLAIIVSPLIEIETTGLLSESVMGFSVALFQSMLAGLLIGFIPLLLFIGVQIGGEVSGLQMGFAIVSVMDPLSQNRMSLIAQLDYIFAFLVFISLNGHLYLLQGIVKSFQVMPLIGASFPAAIGKSILNISSDMFMIGLKIAAPILVTIILTRVGLGFLARTVPQMNIFLVGFPLQIGIGLITLGMSFPVFIYVFEKIFYDFYQKWLTVINAF